MANIDNAILSIYTITDDGFLPSLTLNSWPPLTTPFTFAPTCTEGTKIQSAWQTTDLRLSIPDSCVPSSTFTHSPGTCLSGYQMKEIVEYRTPDWTLGGSRLWGATCCRSDYMDMADYAFGCVSVFRTPITAYKQTSRGGGGDLPENTTVINSGTIYMNPMMAFWQESDLSNFDHDYASTLASKFDIDFTPSATVGPTSETASPPHRSQFASATSSVDTNSEDAVDSSHSGLTTAAKAGVGVGAAIGTTLLCVAGFLMYKRRAQKKAKLDQKSAIQNDQPELVQATVA